MTPASKLRQLLAQDEPVVAPGCFDALSAHMIERAGFDCVYLSGAGIAISKLGRPDIGLVSMAEVADTICTIRDRISGPLVVDGDTGYGNALNVKRTVRLFERMGASAIQLEDQVTPKRCGHFDGKELIPTEEMVGKVKAACDARADHDTIILARTDAIAVEGFESALARGHAYVEAGADMLFVEAPRTVEHMHAINANFKDKVPLLVNMVEGGKTPVKSASELGDMGYSLVIFPGALMRAYTFMAEPFLASLKQHGSSAAWSDRMNQFGDVNRLVGLDELVREGDQYSTKGPDPILKAGE